jgi:hypothetical protein
LKRERERENVLKKRGKKKAPKASANKKGKSIF